MAVKTYRKTALVTAEQFLPAIGQIPKGVYSDGQGDPRKRPDCHWVLDTKEGRHNVRGGDYICTGPAGEQWNVVKEIFEATYEEVETHAPQPQPLPSQPAERDDRRAEVEAATRAERHAEYLDTMADVIMDSSAAGKLEAKSVMMKAAKFIRETASTVDTLTAERDAAFAMSRCECEVNEACRNIAALTADRDRLQSENDSLMNEVTSFRSSFREQVSFKQDNDRLKARVEELEKALEPFAKFRTPEMRGRYSDPINEHFSGDDFGIARQALKGEEA